MGEKIDQRSKIRLVNNHVLSYVMDLIAIKSASHDELERLCLLESKISEIESLYQVTKKTYCNLIDTLFVNDKFLKEIDDCLAYNYPLTTQDCLLSLICEEESSSSSETNKCTAKKSTLSPTKTKESTSSSPETTLNLKDKKVLCHRQNRKKLFRHLQKQINVHRQLQT